MSGKIVIGGTTAEPVLLAGVIRYVTTTDTMTMKRYDADQNRYHDTEPPEIDLEKRLMLSFALLGSFTFGFIFFGDAPTILGLLVLIGPFGEEMLLPKVLGAFGLVAIGFGIWWRESWRWRPATILGAAGLFSSWLLFYGIAGSNLMTLLGTAPFAFFFLWFLSDSIRSLATHLRGREADRRDDPRSPPEELATQPRLAGFFSGLLASLRSLRSGGGRAERAARGRDPRRPLSKML